MNRPVATFVLMLAVLLQGLASAWAAPMGLAGAIPPATASEAAMPCHDDATATDAAIQSGDSHEDAGMSCCGDGGDCTRCNAACVTHPAPLAAAAPFDDYLDAHFALLLRSDAVLLAHPLRLLRPPIEFHG